MIIKKEWLTLILADDEFSREFHAQHTFLEKIQLAIRMGRYTIWRRHPPSFPEEYLQPVLTLSSNTSVKRKALRRSGGPGLDYVLELKVEYRQMGRSIPIYLKGYFAQDASENLVIAFEIQSLKKDDGNL